MAEKTKPRAQALSGDGTVPVSVNVFTMLKDVRSMLDRAAAHKVHLPMTAQTLQSFDQPAIKGLDAADCTQLLF